jgi:hypothetical protein
MFAAQTAYTQFSQFNGQLLSTYAIELEWKTMMERKTDHFVVQRSNDGVRFEDLGTVHTQLTDSTNAYELLYSYTDKSVPPGTFYYRVQIVGKDGRNSYSDVVRLINDQPEGIKMFPTVVQNSNLFIESGKTLKNARLELFDLSGNKISETNWQTLDGRQSVSLDKTGRLASGAYLARLSANGKNQLSQLIILQH